MSFVCNGVPFSRLSPRSEARTKAVAEGDRRRLTSSDPLRCAAPAATSTGPRSSSATWTYPAVVKASPAARALHGPLRPAANTDPTAVFSFPSEASRARAASSVRLQGLDDAPNRRAAVEVGRPALQDLDPLDCGTSDAAPVDPAPEGVVQGHAVEKDERPAGPARPHAAKRCALGGGVRDPAARPPEQGETRHLPQRVVEGQRGARSDVRPAEDDDPLGGVAQPRLGPARGDGHLFPSRGSQYQRERLGRDGRPAAFDVGETRSGHQEPAVARRLEREGAVRGGGHRRSPRSAHRHSGPGHGGAARVPHHAPHDDGPLGAPRQRGDEEEHERAEHRASQDRLPGTATVASAG